MVADRKNALIVAAKKLPYKKVTAKVRKVLEQSKFFKSCLAHVALKSIFSANTFYKLAVLAVAPSRKSCPNYEFSPAARLFA
ncbi:MAG: hypothetical protein LBO71_07575 [Prevotellaceae bacterium]|nr:hypothetical protein [Prevotellaceae bacterium]